MKKNLLSLILVIINMNAILAQTVPSEKLIYIPNDLKSINLDDPSSKWSYKRMITTKNFAIFWEKGFGNDLSVAPALEGHNMTIDIKNLTDKLEEFYSFFRNNLKFTSNESNCDKYRMMVMINYSLEGTAYGGDYDGVIGALWVAPNRIQDKKLNCIAHELGHSFQSQIICDGNGEAWGGCGFFEMASQWMLWQVNPEWITDEKYHWDAFSKLTHKAYLHMDNIYHSPYILEYWSERRGLNIIAELFRAGKKGEDPIVTYKTKMNMSQHDFCNEMFNASCHIITMDFNRVWNETRPYANKYSSKLEETSDGWLKIANDNIPEEYGFNAIRLSLPPDNRVTVEFTGDSKEKNAGWRYGFVTVTKDGNCIYGKVNENNEGIITCNVDENAEYIWLVVMGAPKEHEIISSDKTVTQYPYRINIEGSNILKTISRL